MKFINNLSEGRFTKVSNVLAFESSELELEVIGAMRNEFKEEIFTAVNTEHELFELLIRGNKILTPKGTFSYIEKDDKNNKVVFMADSLGDTSTITLTSRNKFDYNILCEALTTHTEVDSIGDFEVLCNPLNLLLNAKKYENCKIIALDKREDIFICKLWNGNFEPLQALIISCELFFKC